MIYPLLPLFLVGVLHASATSLGWVEGVAIAVVALMTAWSGIRSDRLVNGRPRRVPWVQWGYGLPVIGKAITALAYAWPMVLAGRSIDRLGKGLRSSARDALIADAVDAGARGRAFGFHRAMDSAGAMVGVALAAGLLWWFTRSAVAGEGAAAAREAWAFRVVFAIAAGLGLISWGITFLVKESEVQPAQAAPPFPPSTARAATIGISGTDESPRSPGWLGFSRAYWRTLALLAVFALANSSDSFLLLRARDVGLSPVAVVLAYGATQLTYMLFSYPAGIISDKLGRWRVIGVGWAIYAAVYAGFAVTGSTGVWPLMALYGVYLALTEGVGKALIADHAPRDRRGAAMGMFSMLNGLMMLVSSVVAGIVWDRMGPAATFWLGAGAASAALVLIPVLGASPSRRT